jgi:putative MATE family efflux protein
MTGDEALQATAEEAGRAVGEAPARPSRWWRRPLPFFGRRPDLTSSNLDRNIWFLSGPVIVERILQMMVGVADIAMVGRIGPYAIAAVGLSNQLSDLALALFDAIRVGTTALVARLIGAKDPEEAARVARQSILMSGVIAAVWVTVAVLLAEWGLRVLGAAPDVIRTGVPYLRLKAFSLVFALFTMTVSAVLRGAGDTATPMISGVVINVVHLVANFPLIYGYWGFPALGVVGAGVSTVISQAVGLVVIAAVLLRGRTAVRISPRDDFRWDWPCIKRILNIGLPAVAERGLLRTAQLFYTSIITSLGTFAYAAHQIALRAESMSFMPGFAFGVAATTLVGQNLGARQPGQAAASGLRTTSIAMVAMGAMGVVFFVFAAPLVRIFTNEPEVIKQGAQVLRIIAAAQPFMAMTLVLAGALRGAGDTRWAMVITAGSVWGVRLVLAYILVIRLGWGLAGAWVAMFLDQATRAVLFFLRFRNGGWKTARV